MKRTLLSIHLVGFAVLCNFALPVPASSQTNDSVTFRNVVSPLTTTLFVSPGYSTRITLNLNYALASSDSAVLAVYAEEYPETAGGCRGDVHHTNGASNYPVQRGNGITAATVIWPGNGAAGAAPVSPTGYVTVGASFWTPDMSQQIRAFGVFSTLCYHFAPRPNPPSPSRPPSPPAPNPPSNPSGNIPVFYRWVPAGNGSIPQFAFLGGWEKWQPQRGSTAITTQGPLYVCRASFNGGVYPGKVVGRGCNFSAAYGKEEVASSYQVLTAQSDQYSLDWQSSPSRPANAVVGGSYGDNLYVCQLPYGGGIVPGWVNVQQNGQFVCSIGYGGREVDLPGFAYLVAIRGHRID
jgi:hypothetical protein